MVNARVMFQADSLLVLDELTSEVERLVVQNVLSANPVTHRMVALRSTQKVLVLQNGTIADLGTHEELLRRLGIYAKFVTAERS